MIRYFTHSEIDFKKYDACIAGSLNGILYANSWYLDMVAPDWDLLVEDDYQAVMPLPARKKFGIQYVYQPFFVQQLGVFSPEMVSRELMMRFLDAIPSRFRYVDISLNTFNKVLPDNSLQTRKLPNYELDLIPDYDRLRAGYSTNTIRNIKKAQKHGVFVARHGHPETIIQAFRQNRGKLAAVFSDYDYLVLKHLIYSGMHRGMAQIYTAYSDKNSFCSGIVFFRSHNKVVFLFSGSIALSRENGAMFLLVDTFIRDHAGQALILDFEGSSDPDLARFYSGFGSKECVFLQIKRNRLPALIKPVLSLHHLIRSRRLFGSIP